MRLTVLQRQVLALAAAAVLPLLAYASLHAWSDLRDLRLALGRLHQAQAQGAADRVAAYVQDIEGQLRWGTHRPWQAGDDGQRVFDALRILKASPAVTDLSLLDASGRERMTLSRLSLNRTGGERDRSADPAFVQAIDTGVHYGPVTFRRETEPFMRMAVAGEPRSHGVVVADVNLKHVWDLVATLKVGRTGHVYVSDAQHRLIAHPDISLVLRRTDLPPALHHVGLDAQATPQPLQAGVGLRGEPAMLAVATVAGPQWRVYVELPEDEAAEPVNRALQRALLVTVASLVAACGLALLIARRLVRPIRQLHEGARQLGGGALDHRLDIRTGDEFEALGQAFNAMAVRVQDSHRELEHRVDLRTRELAQANRAMSRFVAAASHDLRQPLHALFMIMGQWRTIADARERAALAQRAEDTLTGVNMILDDLLDLSRLDAGRIEPQLQAFPISALFAPLAGSYTETASERGLNLRLMPGTAWVRSDPALLHRILANLLANALRYTERGSVAIACRRRGAMLRIDVLDSGRGIAPELHRQVFEESFQVERGAGLGLGLAIVARLADLLGHRVDLRSAPGCGSCFSLHVPLAQPPSVAQPQSPGAWPDALRGCRVLLIDDDPSVRAATGDVLKTWGCAVTSLESFDPAAGTLPGHEPDLVIADYHLGGGSDGLAAISRIRQMLGRPDLPALIISADTSAQTTRHVENAGLVLLRKPASPMALRAVMTHALNARSPALRASSRSPGSAATPEDGC